MKKILWILLFALILSVGVFTLCSSAAEENTDAVWLVTHADGKTEYYNEFYDAFTKAKTGDYFKINKSHVEVTGHATTSIANSLYTIDLGSSTVVFTESYYRSTRIAFSGKGNTVRIVGDGAKIFMQTDVVGCIDSGDNRIEIEGGSKLITFHGPCIVNTSYGETFVKNVYMRKNTGNMRGMLCARGDATMEIRDSVICGSSGKYAILANGSGTVDVYNSLLCGVDGEKFIDIDGAGATVTLHDGTYIYGQVNMINGGTLRVDEGVYSNFDVTNYLINGAQINTSGVKRTEQIKTFAAPSSETTSSLTMGFGFVTTPAFVLTPTKTGTSVFRVIDENGSTIGYCDDFYQALLNHKKGQTLRLVRNVDIKQVLPFTLHEKLTVDFGNYNVFISDEASVSSSSNLLTILGKGEFTLIANSSVISTPKEVGFINTGAGVDIVLNLGGAYIFAAQGVNCAGYSVKVTGGYINTNSTKPVVFCLGDVTLDSCVLLNEGGGKAVENYGAILSKNSELVVNNEEVAISTVNGLEIEGGIISGKILSPSVSAKGEVRFSHSLDEGCKTDFFSSNELKVHKFVAFSHKGYSIVRREIYVKLSYVTRNVSGNLLANFTLDNHLSLNVYIPTFVFGEDGKGGVRIVVDGLLYNVDKEMTEKCYYNHVQYYKIAYPFIYHDGLDADARIDCFHGDHMEQLNFRIIDQLVASMAECSDQNIRRAVGAYLRFAFEVEKIEGHEDILAGYSEFEYPLYTGTDNETLASVLRTAVFSVEGYITLYFNKGIEKAEASYTYGGRTVTSELKDGSLRLLTFRIAPYDEITLTYTDESGEHTVSCTLTDLYGTTSLGDTYASRVFRSYIVFLTSVLGAEAEEQTTANRYPITENEFTLDGTDTPLIPTVKQEEEMPEEDIKTDIIPDGTDTPVTDLIIEIEE